MVVFLGSAVFASANVIQIGSYGSTATAPSAFGNTATFYQPSLPTVSTATYNLPSSSNTWASALGGSSWISFDPNSYPGGSSTPINATYVYQTTFSVASSPYLSGSVSVLADDAATVFLNGHSLNAVNGVTPGLQTIATFLLPATYLQSGVNTLTFDVQQVHGGATGLDYSGTISTTPEPASLVLLGTGLLAAAMVYKRRLAQSMDETLWTSTQSS